MQRTALLAIGSLLLAAIMAAGGISMGMHVAEESPPPAGPLAAQLEILDQIQKLPRPAEMIGRVQSASDSSLSLSTPDGPHTFAMDGDTRVILADGEPGARRDLKRGMDVAVAGELSDGGRSLRAEVVAVLPRRN
jgi:hypothetical protein